jgi:NTP pyrophosphatase (non-canonical NTP hydrolase)
MPNKLNLNDKVIQWAGEKGILSNATPAAQYQKTVEEVGELGRALIEEEIACGAEDFEGTGKAHHEIKDAIGDIVVTLIIQCELQGTTLEECVQQAYDVISQRKGKMVNGIFVKDE